VVRLIHNFAAVVVTVILVGSIALSQSDSERLGMSAGELARKVVNNELKIQDEDRGHWMYRLEKEESGEKQVLEILETNNGSLSRVLSIGGQPLDAKQQQKENLHVHSSLLNVVLHDDDGTYVASEAIKPSARTGKSLEPPVGRGEPPDKERARRPLLPSPARRRSGSHSPTCS
jgi:hypothetical protein